MDLHGSKVNIEEIDVDQQRAIEAQIKAGEVGQVKKRQTRSSDKPSSSTSAVAAPKEKPAPKRAGRTLGTRRPTRGGVRDDATNVDAEGEGSADDEESLPVAKTKLPRRDGKRKAREEAAEPARKAPKLSPEAMAGMMDKMMM